jgi:hypothetical protein
MSARARDVTIEEGLVLLTRLHSTLWPGFKVYFDPPSSTTVGFATSRGKPTDDRNRAPSMKLQICQYMYANHFLNKISGICGVQEMLTIVEEEHQPRMCFLWRVV